MTNSFDQLSRMTQQAHNLLGSTYYEYDLAGRRTKLTYTDSFYVNYDYFVTGDVQKIRENGATSGTGVLATFAYDDMGRRMGLTRGNGTSAAYSYDSASNLTGLVEDLASTGADLTTTLTYTLAGQIATRYRSNDNYAWNAAATVNRGYASNGLNQYTDIGLGLITPTYDNKGNLTSAGAPTYTFDSENKLVAATSPTASLSYDPMARLFQVTANSVTTRFGYDGDDLIAEYNGSNAIQRKYVHGPGDDEPLVWYEGSTRHWLHADERGSIIAESNDSGTSTATNTFDEYGIPGTSNGGSRFQYTGQVWLADLGMYHYKSRVYSAALGRFLQADPIGYDDGMNLYAYVKSDPINRKDPSGNDGADIVVVGRLCGSTCAALAAEAAEALRTLTARLSAFRFGPQVAIIYYGFRPTPTARDDTCARGCVLANEAEDADKSWDDVAGDAETGEDGQKEKDGGKTAADKDFDKLKGTEDGKVRAGGQRVKTLSDGTRAVLRPSSDGRWTIERQSPSGRKPDAGSGRRIRYNN